MSTNFYGDGTDPLTNALNNMSSSSIERYLRESITSDEPAQPVAENPKQPAVDPSQGKGSREDNLTTAQRGAGALKAAFRKRGIG